MIGLHFAFTIINPLEFNYISPQSMAPTFGAPFGAVPGYASPQVSPIPTYQNSMTGLHRPAQMTGSQMGQNTSASQSPYAIDSRGVMKNVEHGTVSITGYKGVFVGNLDPNTVASDLHDALGPIGRLQGS